MHSNFAKGFLATKSGRLFAYGDLDLIEIKNLGDTVIFKSICPVARNSNDSTLSYPKSLFEDSQGNLWVSESQSVVKLKGKSFKRYNFELAYRSPQFLRSFIFFEDLKQNLFISSFQGNIFRYNNSTDQFNIQKEKFPEEVEHVAAYGNRLLIGSLVGLSESKLLEEGGFTNPEVKLKTPYVSYVSVIKDETFFIATRTAKHFISDLKENTFTPIKYSVNNINHVYRSRENDLWLSGNDGLIAMKENLIQEASNHVNNFIEAIAEDVKAGKIYYATSTTLYTFDIASQRNEEILTFPNGYYQSIAITKDGMWIANAFNVYLYQNKKIVKHFDFSKDGRFITDITHDSHGNLWIAEPGNADIYMIDPAYQLHKIKIPLEGEGTINMICEGRDGMYIASTGKRTYLFHKSPSDSIFRNISLPVKFKTHGDFNVTDLVIIDHVIWLATSEGLLKYDGKEIERANIGTTFSELPVRSIKLYPQSQLLLGNAFGMILYKPETGECDLFNESSGMLSNTITPHGLFVSKNQSVWIGTSKGLCYSTRPLMNMQKTPTPRFVTTRTNGKAIRLNPKKEIEYRTFISFEISSITFPEKEVIIQYKFENESGWHTATNSEVNFSSLAAGKYTLQVRSKKNGPYSWSDIAVMNFVIAKPFWQRFWFFLLCSIATALVVLITVLSANTRHKKRNQELQMLVAERTNALRLTNEELAHRNNELDRFVYSASHDLSAPLKSILGLITVAKMEKPNPSMDNYLDMMKRSILKLDSFIKDIISYSRNTRLEIKKEVIDFDVMVKSIWDDLLFTPDADKIRFEVVNHLKSELKSDETRLKIIFNNLLSNAIKFHFSEKESFIKVIAEESSTHFEFTVEDNGIGISKDYKEKIFDMFFRANETVQGSGLGLYILKETVSRLNGTVKVESDIGEGTTFFIQLPK
jgi:signal transduction histidine kinase